MTGDFAERLSAIERATGTNLCLWLRPTLREMPLAIQKYDDPFLPFSRTVIAATHDIVCAFMFDLASYMALGAAGTVALERSIAHAAAEHDALTILHGPFYGPDYAQASAPLAFNADAVTIVRAEDAPAYHSVGVHAFVTGVDASSMINRFDGSTLLIADWNGAGQTTLRVIAEDALGRGYDEDFAEKARAALEALR